MFSTAHFAAITNFNANVKIMNLFLNKLQVLVFYIIFINKYDHAYDKRTLTT